MSRNPRTPGACGALLSEPRRGAPARSRVGGSCGSCIETCGWDCGGCGRGIGGASARRLRGGRASGRSCSSPSGGRSLRGCSVDGGRGRGGGEGSDVEGGDVEGCDAEGGDSE